MSFLDYFRETKRIYGLCPCCGEAFRLSEATIFTRRRPPQTAFDRLAKEWAALKASNERFDERQERIEEGSRESGRRNAQRRLARIAPFFISRKIQPKDVKVLFDPVDYVAFCGLGEGGCRSVDFIDRPPISRRHERIQNSLDAALRNRRIEWRTYRITPEGIVTSDP